MAGFYDEWVITERYRLQTLFLDLAWLTAFLRRFGVVVPAGDKDRCRQENDH